MGAWAHLIRFFPQKGTSYWNIKLKLQKIPCVQRMDYAVFVVFSILVFSIFNIVYLSTVVSVCYTVDVKCWWNVNIIRLISPRWCCRCCSAMFHYHHRRHRHHKLLSLPLPSIRIFQNQLTHMHQNRSTIRRFLPITSSRIRGNNNNSPKSDLFLQLKLNDNAIEWMNISCDDDHNEHEATFLFQADEIKKKHPLIHPMIWMKRRFPQESIPSLIEFRRNSYYVCVNGWDQYVFSINCVLIIWTVFHRMCGAIRK